MGDAWFGTAFEVGDDAVADVSQVGCSFGHDAALAFELYDELIGCGHCRLDGGDAARNFLLNALAPGRIARDRRSYFKEGGSVAGRILSASLQVRNDYIS